MKFKAYSGFQTDGHGCSLPVCQSYYYQPYLDISSQGPQDILLQEGLLSFSPGGGGIGIYEYINISLVDISGNYNDIWMEATDMATSLEYTSNFIVEKFNGHPTNTQTAIQAVIHDRTCLIKNASIVP
ncbi:hypothetical protein F4814DRAFT_444420 [Daldinia grandis]|nr:hypothetical protein F4814DRAFT_444420 [Daldinia grandis]